MKKDAYILITGGTGYIGSHNAVLLLEKGYGITVLDNLSKSPVRLDRIARLHC